VNDLIDRETTLKDIEKIRQNVQMLDDTQRASIIMTGIHLCEKAMKNQPSIQLDNDMIHLQKEQAYLKGWEEGREALRKEMKKDV